MLATTHLLLAILLIKWFDLDRNEALMVLLFGVFIDLDHVFGVIEFIGREGWGNITNIHAALSSDIEWKSQMHQPIAAAIIAPTTWHYRLMLPMVAWGMHLIMDYVQMNYLGIASPFEMVFMSLLVLALVKIEHMEYSAVAPVSSKGTFLSWEKDRLSAALNELTGRGKGTGTSLGV